MSFGWVCLDIETGNAGEDAISAAIARWKPPGNIRDKDKIDVRRQEAMDKIRERAALLDFSPILCVSLQTDNNIQVVFNGMGATAPAVSTDWLVLNCDSERDMLRTLREFLDGNTGPDTALIGHNIRAFDLPKLRGAYVRHSLRLPEIFKPRFKNEESPEIVDTAVLFKFFSMEHYSDMYTALDTVATTLGIDSHKKHVSGGDCPRLFEDGQIQTILTYCAVDCATTVRAYQLMTSSAPDLA